MTLDCSKCLSKCAAECCSIVPFPSGFRFKHRPVRETTETVSFGRVEIYMTKDGKCPYLESDLKCSIHKHRPNICRKFGNEKHLCLTCPYQDKNGRIRGDKEREGIEREQETMQDVTLKTYEKRT